MIPPRLVLLAVGCSFSIGTATATELAVRIETYPEEIKFGDPVFVRVMITNTGTEVAAAKETYHSDRLRFEFRESETQIMLGKLDGEGQRSPLKFVPDETTTFYQYVFVPSVNGAADHPFWLRLSSGGFCYLTAVYRFNDDGTEFRSNSADLPIGKRDPHELRFLRRWAFATFRGTEKGPMPSDFGLSLNATTRQQTAQVASGVAPGEIADILHLTMRLQDIYHGPDAAVAAESRELLAWFETLPDIKRQALAKQAHSICESHLKLFPTAKALEPLFKDQ